MWVVALGIAGVIAVALIAPYVRWPEYRYPPAAPFRGTSWYNPYAGVSGRWLKANFHAHSRSWLGLTNGALSDSEVIARYRAMGYDLPGLSNYQRVDGGRLDDPRFLPIYEHGFGVAKVHALAIAPTRVVWFDFPLGQTLAMKQYGIDRLRAASALVAVVHPRMRHAYEPADMRRLAGYRLLEVLHAGDPPATAFWDAALSAGRVVWAIGDDDSHDLRRMNEGGLSWTMVAAREGPGVSWRGAVIEALRAGRSYAVSGRGAVEDVRLTSLVLRGDTLVVRCDRSAVGFTLVGQEGRVLALRGAGVEARYVVRPTDSYVRTVIRGPRTTLYLNPIIRADQARLPAERLVVGGSIVGVTAGALAERVAGLLRGKAGG